MTQVFISYRHISPDQDLARFLEGYLKSQGLDVFIDTQMLVGDKWVEEIERHIRASSFFIALLSADSIRSDMVRQEVELAHALPQVTILPIRVAFEGALPYDLASYLNLIRQALYALATDAGLSLAKLKEVAPSESGPFGDHLRRYNWLLQESRELKDALRQVLRDNCCADEKLFQRLRAAGLIRGETRHSARMRCELYARYFKQH